MIDDPRYLLPSSTTSDPSELLPAASAAVPEWGTPILDPPESWTAWGASIIPSTVSSIIPTEPNLDEYAAYMKDLRRRAENARVAFDEALHRPALSAAPAASSSNTLGLALLVLGAAGVVAGLLIPSDSDKR